MIRLGGLAALIAAVSLTLLPREASAQAHPIAPATAKALAVRPGVPPAGNAKGDVTVIEFMDYNCPYCRKLAPELAKLIKADRQVRVLYKDWPIFGGVSVYAAKVALAAALQGKYLQVHDALIGSPGRLASEQQVREIARRAGVNLAGLELDLKAHGSELDALLKRNNQEAESLGLEGTPGLVVGSQLVFGGMPEAQLQQLVAQSRGRR